MTRLLFATATAAVVTTALVCGAAPALADVPSAPLAPRSTFTVPIDPATGTVAPPPSGEAIPNIDSVKSTIRRYYAATGGVANKTASPYLHEVNALWDRIDRAYPLLGEGAWGKKAIVFDTDDTLLWNYDFEDKATQFNFDPAVNADWVAGTDPSCAKVNGFCFPAIPGTPALVRKLWDRGYRLYVITGRPSYQEQSTVDNLAAAGFTIAAGDPIFKTANVFTKWGTNASPGKPDTYDAADVPAYISDGQCTTAVSGIPGSYKCTTVEYKAQTRRHIEATDGVEIVGNIGDQLSDLWGGYADKAWKIPNPTYFLASPNLDAAHVGADDQSAQLRPATQYTMRPDGSSGARPAGDAIPNIDPVRSEIRAYYGAVNGIANKTSSAYLTEMAGLSTRWQRSVTADCRAQAAKAARGAAKEHRRAAKAVVRAKHSVSRAKAAVKRAAKAVKKARSQHSSVRKQRQARAKLAHARRVLVRAKGQLKAARYAAGHVNVNKPAVVFDADDTTLWTYDMEDGAMKFVYTPAAAAEWVLGQKFPATPKMVGLAQAAKRAGCAVIGLTGRPDAQKAATIANLTKVGYVDGRGAPLFSPSLYFTKPAGTTGTTVHYKSGTRRHIERDLKFSIVGNVGDQYSDLIGGYAKVSYKLPNPTYYLP